MITVIPLDAWGLETLYYAPSVRNLRFACGWYGVGHTARRHPGEMRGTVIGRHGRFRESFATQGGDD